MKQAQHQFTLRPMCGQDGSSCDGRDAVVATMADPILVARQQPLGSHHHVAPPQVTNVAGPSGHRFGSERPVLQRSTVTVEAESGSIGLHQGL